MIKNIKERNDVVKYLRKRNLTSQYKKAKNYILNLENISGKIKKRKPKQDGVFHFRINKQYRAYCYFDNKKHKNTLIVFEINNHQN